MKHLLEYNKGDSLKTTIVKGLGEGALLVVAYFSMKQIIKLTVSEVITKSGESE